MVSEDESYSDPSFLKGKIDFITSNERQLESMHANEDAEKQAAARVKLCEAYSDIFLRNPKLALEQQLQDRLWRNCFYRHISDQRRELSRRKKRRQNLEETKQKFSQTLSEAISLYAYIIAEYLGFIEPELSSSQQSVDESPELDERGEEAVVTILHKFEIYLGDLHRYKDEYKEAARHYERAILWAPGQGNPYNQMAVLEQLNESSCTALYWYARSIMASGKPFETSSSNVERLFLANRKWLKENPTDGIPTKTADKAKKSAALKRFNAGFVDLQFELRMSDKPEAGAKNSMEERVDAFIYSLADFLSTSSLGDTLLCRMVVISAWTASTCQDARLAQTFILRFGRTMADLVEQNLSKLSVEALTLPSIRGLSPLLLTCDYASRFEFRDGEDHASAEMEFWAKVSSVANKVKAFADALQLENFKGMVPKEYKDLIGFSAFEAFIDPPRGILSFQEAKKVLPQVSDSASVASRRSERMSSSEVQTKLSRLMVIMDQSSKVGKLLDGSYRYAADQAMEIEADEEEDDAPAVFDEDKEPAGDVLMYKSPEHGAGPALLVPGALLQGKAGSTPEQPAASLESLTDPVEEEPQAPRRQFPTPMATNIVQQPTPVSSIAPPPGLRAPPGLSPPPGFAPPASSQASATPQQHNPLDFLAQIPTANPFFHASQPQTTQPTAVPAFSVPFDSNSFLNQEEPTQLLDSSLLQSLWGEEKPVSNNPFLTEQKW